MGKIQKFFIANKEEESQEIDFITAAKIFECLPEEKRRKLSKNFYNLLDKNKKAFIDATTEEYEITLAKRGKDSGMRVLKILKATLKNSQKLTDKQEEYLKKVITRLEEGSIPKKTIQKTLKALNELNSDLTNPLKVLATIQRNIPDKLLESHYSEYRRFSGKREVILSLYLTEENNE